MKYFEVTVNIKTETEGYKGATKVKTVKEMYLVDAMSVTEAEARVVKSFSQSGFSQDYEVVGVRGSKVVEVIEAAPTKNIQTAKQKDEEVLSIEGI